MRSSSNPALTRSPAFAGQPVGFGSRPQSADPLEQAYFSPTATSLQTGRMTVEDVVVRTGVLLGAAIVTGAATWLLGLEALAFPAALVGLVLGLVIAFKQLSNPALIISYALVEGVFLGGLSKIFEARYPGIVLQAVVGTVAVAAAMLGLYSSGRIRVTPQFTKMVVGATLGFLGLILVNLLVSAFHPGGLGLGSGPLGLIISLVAIGLASMNLVLDFDLVAQGARRGLPERFAWFAAFGLLVTLVWLYVELLRLLSILRQR